MGFWKALLSKIPGRAPEVYQMTEDTLVWNIKDGKLYGLKVNEDGTKEVVLITGTGGPSHDRAHQITSVLDHPAVDERDRGKMVATNPLTGAIELIDIPISYNPVKFRQTADKTITNTTVETTLFGTGVGSLVIPANTFVAGSTIRLRMQGVISSPKDSAEEVTFKVYLGNTVLTQMTGNLFQGMEAAALIIDLLITCRSIGSNGTVMPAGAVIIEIRSVGYQSLIRLNSSNPISINTTIDNTLNLTFKWTAAKVANSITTNVSLVESM